MKIKCPGKSCSILLNSSPNAGSIIRNGSYYRRSDGRRVRRFYCKSCSLFFSLATLNPCYRQKKRRINFPLYQLCASGVSQRRAAKILGVNRKTVVRHFRFIAVQKRLEQEKWLKHYEKSPLEQVQFDDLETSEHTKCKPLSVALAIDPKTRKILNYQVSQMPAKGHLVRIAFKKYGYREDLRGEAWARMMEELVPIVSKRAVFTSDENPHYPRFIKKYHPEASHVQIKGGRGAITGQGELKKLKYDPIFALNHTCAMLRANMNRLFRKTWCTTKNQQGLKDHLALFVSYFNQSLTPLTAGRGAS